MKKIICVFCFKQLNMDFYNKIEWVSQERDSRGNRHQCPHCGAVYQGFISTKKDMLTSELKVEDIIFYDSTDFFSKLMRTADV